MTMHVDIIKELYHPETWWDYLEYKKQKHHISLSEEKQIGEFIRNSRYIPILDEIVSGSFIPPLAARKEINKEGSRKKRVVYSYPEDFQIFLKACAFLLFCYDDLFTKNCYAFRRHFGVKDAIQRICAIKNVSEKFCLKVDISNYFNSIDVGLLMKKLLFLKDDNVFLYNLFRAMLEEQHVIDNGEVIQDSKGAMAGIPVSAFFANVYLMDVDTFFEEKEIFYFRYSDDILIFADDEESLMTYKGILFQKLQDAKLQINPDKLRISRSDEPVEFLGFSFLKNQVELSDHTRRKIKGKIKRKAAVLRRWADKKNLSGEKAAKGFITAMNRKFFSNEEDFSWSRWFFPNLTVTDGLREIDAYMQQYIRYCVTGRHYKGNYRITYGQMKQWGYRNLVHEYYSEKKSFKEVRS